ncbi:elicitor-responsive protein 3-like [Chenopodium quinoa]|uniref:elicitor-responsive protein 3-like n=1 Tax=Chenopodium quinoa TaxID=63459 RepID=UPI000B78E142|nr:elicitor-responsive protein 3-like [Chenopodium quinoa]
MAQGTLKVVLINAKGLENSGYLNKMDPYVILSYGGRTQSSKIASGNLDLHKQVNYLYFELNSGGADLTLKIMDSDCGTEDDCVGEATIPLEPVLEEGSVPTASYNVVKGQEFRGQIKLSLFFTHKAHDHGVAAQEESYGGWGESH